MNQPLIEKIILKNLDNIAPRMMAEGVLWNEVHLDDDSVSFTAFRKALTSLQEKGQAVVIDGEDRNKVKITQAGAARLAE